MHKLYFLYYLDSIFFFGLLEIKFMDLFAPNE